MSKVDTYLQHESLYRPDGVVAKRKQAKILLCGGGALGSWLSDLLARQGYWNQTVLDRDKVEDANFGTQNFGKADVGRPKATQIRVNAFRRFGVTVKDVVKSLTKDNAKALVKGFDLVVDLFDNGESRELVQFACEPDAKIWRKGIPCLHAGVAAMGFFQVQWNERYIAPSTVEEEGAPCDYPLAANLVLMCVATTAEVINRFFESGEKRDIEFWLNSMSLEINQS